jgi:transposase-like protein
MTEHLDHAKNGRADPGNGNVPNATRPKRALTESTGQVGIEVPQDRDGTFNRRSCSSNS